MSEFLHIDLIALIQALGYLGLFAIVFAESGLFFGFFFPGDSLLFTAGLLASQGFLNVWVLVPLIISAAVLGDTVGYWFGAKVGPKIFTREDSFFFHTRHVERTRSFYERYGVKTIVLARFIPIVRTFAPILAGVGSMRYSVFLRYNLIGGILWGAGVTLFGYSLGAVIPGIDRYLLPIILLIIVVSFLPIVAEMVKNRHAPKREE
ncbi:MAG: VTT domain-containing protein [Patescibacteria group bacterium]